MNQIGIFTGLTFGASVLLLFEVLRRRASAPSVKRGHHLDGGAIPRPATAADRASGPATPIVHPRVPEAPAMGQAGTAAAISFALLRMI
jgi:hypothetical protein